MARLKVGVMKLFDLCSKLDKIPYKRSSDERFSYLFQADLRNYLFELGLPLTYYNKMYQEFGLKKDWKENLLKLDEFLGGKFQESLLNKMKEHEKEMELLEKRKKERERKAKSKLVSRFQKVEKVKEPRTKELVNSLPFDYPSKYNPYFNCFVCGFDLNEVWRFVGSKKVCTDCMEEVLEHYGVSWYHNHIKYKQEAFEMDLKKVLADKDFVEEVKVKKKPIRSREISLEWILNENDDYSFYEEKSSTVYFLQLKGVSYEGREELIEKMGKEQKIWFKAEPDNPHDKKAVGVWTIINKEEKHIGYVPALISERFFNLLRAGFVLEPFINSFYTKRYSYSYPDQYTENGVYYEGEWNEVEGAIRTICMEVHLGVKELEYLEKMKEKENYVKSETNKI